MNFIRTINQLPPGVNGTIRAFQPRSFEELSSNDNIDVRPGLSPFNIALALLPADANLNQVASMQAMLPEIGIRNKVIHIKELKQAIFDGKLADIKLRDNTEKTIRNVMQAVLARIGEEEAVLNGFNLYEAMAKLENLNDRLILMLAYLKYSNFSEYEKGDCVAQTAKELHPSDIPSCMSLINETGSILFEGDLNKQSEYFAGAIRTMLYLRDDKDIGAAMLVSSSDVLYEHNLDLKITFICMTIKKLFPESLETQGALLELAAHVLAMQIQVGKNEVLARIASRMLQSMYPFDMEKQMVIFLYLSKYVGENA